MPYHDGFGYDASSGDVRCISAFSSFYSDSPRAMGEDEVGVGFSQAYVGLEGQ